MEHDNLFIQILEILSIKYTEDFTIRFYESHPHKNNLFGPVSYTHLTLPTSCLDCPRCYVIII